MARTLFSAKSYLERRYGDTTPGQASDYFEHLPALKQRQPVRAVIAHCRVSGPVQEWRGNLDDAEAALRHALRRLGLVVINCYRECGSGWREDRPQLAAAIAEAKEYGVPLVGMDVGRFIRNLHYKGDGTLPTVADFEWLAQAADGVTLATVVEPDAPPGVVRSLEVKRGQQAKGHKGGRPRTERPKDKARRRAAVRWLWRHCDESIRGIVAATGTPRRTVRRWIKE